MMEIEVLVLLKALDVGYVMLLYRDIKVFTRLLTLAWLVQFSGLNGRPGRWVALLSNWTLEVTKCEKGGGEILGNLAVSKTPLTEVNEMLTAIATKRQPRKTITMPLHKNGDRRESPDGRFRRISSD